MVCGYELFKQMSAAHDETLADRQLDAYAEIFAYCRENGHLPEGAEDDVLAQYVQRVIDENPQLAVQPPLMWDVLRDHLLQFFRTLMPYFIDIWRSALAEEELMERFRRANLDGKRELWTEVMVTIKMRYQSDEVDINGYLGQFKDNDAELVIGALLGDWQRMAPRKRDQLQRNLLMQNAEGWEETMKQCGKQDFEQRRKMEMQLAKDPVMQEIIKILGREQEEKQTEEKDYIVLKYKPLLLSPQTTSQEVERIAMGNDISHVLHSELMMLDDRDAEMLFYYKFASKQLQLFANRPPETAQKKTEKRQENKPRLQAGPMIVALDTSGSMEGKPLKLAAGLLLQLVNQAQKTHRKCLLISFSVRAQTIDLAQPGNCARLQDFLEHDYNGGTDCEEMLSAALKTLQTKAYKMADVLIISDFCMPLPRPETRKRLDRERQYGTKFYGLQVGYCTRDFGRVLDRVWHVKT